MFATIYQDTACRIILLECYVFPITFPIFSISRNKKVLSNLCTSAPKKYFTAPKKITTLGQYDSEDIDLKLRNAVPGG